MYNISPSNFFLCSLRKVISNSIICSLESQDLVIEWLDEDGGKKKVLLPGKARIINIRAGVSVCARLAFAKKNFLISLFFHLHLILVKLEHI